MNTLTELKHKIKYIPQLPEYIRCWMHKEILFISAKVVPAKRVRTYFTPTHKRNKVDKLVSIADLSTTKLLTPIWRQNCWNAG